MKRMLNGRVLRGDSTPVVPPVPTEQSAAALSEARVNEIVNGALQRFTKQDLPKAFEPFNTQFTSLGESLKTLLEGRSTETVAKPVETPGVSPETNAIIKALQKQVEGLTKTSTEDRTARAASEAKAQQTDKESKIRAVLNQFDFISADAHEDAYQLVEKSITRGEDGTLISGDNLPFDAFIKDYIPTKKAYLLSAENKKGSGATGSSTSRVGGKAVGLETIRAGMTNEELQAVAKQIAEASGSLFGK